MVSAHDFAIVDAPVTFLDPGEGYLLVTSRKLQGIVTADGPVGDEAEFVEDFYDKIAVQTIKASPKGLAAHIMTNPLDPSHTKAKDYKRGWLSRYGTAKQVFGAEFGGLDTRVYDAKQPDGRVVFDIFVNAEPSSIKEIRAASQDRHVERVSAKIVPVQGVVSREISAERKKIAGFMENVSELYRGLGLFPGTLVMGAMTPKAPTLFPDQRLYARQNYPLEMMAEHGNCRFYLAAKNMLRR